MRSAYLGQFTDETANEIAGQLEEAGIHWSYKQAGWLTQMLFVGEWGTRLFVDSERLEEARDIAERVKEATGDADGGAQRDRKEATGDADG
jgi:hypothetical protein